jgi:6-phosphogluconolactonase (cycloisomerase 2 family)
MPDYLIFHLRHLDFWPPTGRSKYLYLLNQLSNTIMVFDISTPSLGAAPKLIQTISTRGAGLPPSDPNIDINAAEVVVTPDGGLPLSIVYPLITKTTGKQVAS